MAKFTTHKKLNQGFTLIELMVTIAIVAILLTVAVPSMQDTMIRSAVSGNGKNLRTALQNARSIAVNRGVEVVICDSTNGTACNNPASTWEGGWIAFVDDNNNGAANAGEEILFIEGATGGNITITLDNAISFGKDGYLPSAAEFKFCHSNNEAKYARGLILGQVGIVRSSLDSDSDGVYEGSVGALSCP